jgi:uncharacterized OB-fold protein
VSDEYGFPLPVPGVVSQPFWDGLKEHRLLVQRCVAGGHLFLYPREFCPVCHTAELEWQPVSGRGRVHSFTVVHRAANPVFQQEKAPYVFALIQLDEGPILTSNVEGVEPDAVTIDMPVEVQFDDVTDEVTLPKFRPATG